MSNGWAHSAATILVVGVGGCGARTLSVLSSGPTLGNDELDVDLVMVGTDAGDIARSGASRRIQLGEARTRGKGTGGNPEIGYEAALADEGRIAELVSGADVVVLTMGLGGGTGSGAGPLVARVARQRGATVFALLTLPDPTEGPRVHTIAHDAKRALEPEVHALLIQGAPPRVYLPRHGMPGAPLSPATPGWSIGVRSGLPGSGVSGARRLLLLRGHPIGLGPEDPAMGVPLGEPGPWLSEAATMLPLLHPPLIPGDDAVLDLLLNPQGRPYLQQLRRLPAKDPPVRRLSATLSAAIDPLLRALLAAVPPRPPSRGPFPDVPH